MREISNVEVIRGSVHDAVDTRTRARLITDVGALVGAVRQRLIAIGKHDEISALEGDEAIHLPSTDGAIQNPVHVLANGTAAAYRRFINCAKARRCGT